MRVRYFILVTINRSYNRVTREEEFIVFNPTDTEPESLSNVKNEVGIDGVLHIEFEFDKSHYHLKDCVLGKIYFN